jgi:hypothetical protein
MKKLIEDKQNQNTIFSDPTHGSQIHLETFLFLQMFSLLVNITMSLMFLFCFFVGIFCTILYNESFIYRFFKEANGSFKIISKCHLFVIGLTFNHHFAYLWSCTYYL